MSVPKWLIATLILSLFPTAYAGEFELSSTDLAPDGWLPAEQVFDSFGCAGRNMSPVLAWTGLPPDTKSLALTFYDPDAPTGSGWWHWVIVNIPPTAKGLARDAGNRAGNMLPPGAIQVRTDFGEPGYGGACPPPGDKPHRYIFTAYALKIEHIDLPTNATAALAGFMITANMIEKTTLTVHYGR
ncbi:YbhB/YbcL family Raf kinase inhibitor-like protein [Paraburkholderia caledonica]|uniref:YbhB/YbcL family Raf kinase inhibitor-like protein n=1 Tax=Paraburkholderia caledonica TaxID=134536 RepID=UPI000DEF7C01|nr:YbhB/YbcL family Raf kinase inhibitor-like protein [Paraburkholderia caledonica]AXF18954.1 YbhB/YbcL family Raf kinase inhibitor-like protein [Paraburkholderia caledonica]